MNQKILLEDNSGDKEFFTIIPNYIANHSTANAQSLYFQMKKYAGESGKCFATEQTLMKKMKVGKKAFDKALNYLLKKKWVTFIGLTQGKTRPIKTYKINNIWKMNNNHYNKISSESNISFKKDTSPKLRDTSQKQHKISAESNVEEEPYIIRTNNKRTPSQEMKLFLTNKEEPKRIAQAISKKSNLPYEQVLLELENFTGYWSELNKSGTKQRWQLEKTFELKRRLGTWFKNKDKFGDKKKPYFRDMRIVEKNNKKFCVPNDGGSWLEFCGEESEIIYK